MGGRSAEPAEARDTDGSDGSGSDPGGHISATQMAATSHFRMCTYMHTSLYTFTIGFLSHPSVSRWLVYGDLGIPPVRVRVSPQPSPLLTPHVSRHPARTRYAMTRAQHSESEHRNS